MRFSPSRLANLKQQALASEYATHIDKLLAANPDRTPYFVTTAFADFETNARDVLKAKINYSWDKYDDVYRHILTALMNNFSFKRHLHPLTFDFIDLPGTRYSRHLNKDDPKTPHIHSIYLIHDKTLSRFEELRAESFTSITSHPKLRALISIHAVPLVKDTTKHLFDYASKLYCSGHHLESSAGVNLFNQYPIAKYKRLQAELMPSLFYSTLHTSNQHRHFPCSRFLPDFTAIVAATRCDYGWV
jgi:hypothetical protein